jgi:LPXTG-motif cell wall-anchored protein
VVSSIAITVVAFLALSGVAFAQKVAPNPATVSITEGQSHDVDFQLDAPIISPVGSSDPDVTINFTVGDPSRVSLSTNSLEWDPSAWAQVRTLTVNALHDGVHDSTNSVTVQFDTVSGSPYYSGFSGSFTVDLADIDPPPATTTTSVAPTTTSIGSPPTTRPSSTTATTSTFAPTTTAAAVSAVAANGNDDELPPTGTTNSLALTGAALVALGALLLGLNRRRRATA